LCQKVTACQSVTHGPYAILREEYQMPMQG